jgi:LmbE family N-acetylglucosaminyl deacetylase
MSAAIRRLAAMAVMVSVSLLSAREPLPQDRGAAGTWQKLLKLRSIGSVMHTTAHPDDEHGGLLAMLSRGEGARVSLLTLTRGEAGDNAIGSELFDALGLIRTEELLRAGQYYGVDEQYFTTAIDYGFSKRLEEALVQWGRENVLRDVVRVIRMERPLVLVSRFQGNERDGHGNHQAAGLITQDAYRVAGDPNVFPDQIREGLRPWQPLKLYMGGVRENEDWTLRVDTAVYSPWLGDTYANFARTGLSFQRSQNSGRNDPLAGPAYAYYKRLASQVDAPAKETSLFDGIDTRIAGVFAAVRHPAPSNARPLLEAVQREVEKASQAFTMDDPSAIVPALVAGVTAVRAARSQFAADLDAGYVLGLKEQQFEDAISTALGIDFSATARPIPNAPGSQLSTLTVSPVVAGQSFDIHLTLTNHGSVALKVVRYEIAVSGGDTVRMAIAPAPISRDQSVNQIARLTVPALAPVSRPYFARSSLADNRYAVVGRASPHAAAAAPAFVATMAYEILGIPVSLSVPVTRREPQLPYGYAARELEVLPALAVNVSPRHAIVPIAQRDKRLLVQVELINNAAAGSAGQIALKVPAGWTTVPASLPFSFPRAGEKAQYRFMVGMGFVDGREYEIEAIATSNGQEFKQGYDILEHRDLETRYLFRDAISRVRGVDVKFAPGLKVGYVMGVGDEVPAGIAQLGAQVRLLESQDLASADLGQYDAIMTGTRAYAVRDDLRTHNRRLLDYVQNGGNLIVLYNTPAEFDPNVFAPFPAQLPRDAEEVSEEDSPVRILAAGRPEFTTPNAITAADFDGWVEQRGSKFFTEWDRAYTPMIETHDQGQAPQRGGWVTAAYGKGHYTYFAYAFHRQLPYGVPGAYRLLANLLSLGKP